MCRKFTKICENWDSVYSNFDNSFLRKPRRGEFDDGYFFLVTWCPQSGKLLIILNLLAGTRSRLNGKSEKVNMFLYLKFNRACKIHNHKKK